jgi:hypothetical protein
MAKCEYEFSFKIKCDEPVKELRIRLIDKAGRRTQSTVTPPESRQESLDFGESSDISDEIPPEMNAIF